MRNERSLLKQNYHAAAWNEPIIMQMGRKGERGILVPEAEEEIKEVVGDVLSRIPTDLRRTEPPKLPEISQPQVVRHFLRLSQMCLGTDLNIDIGQGTCTMKYSPKVNEYLARLPDISELHPLQDEETVQGILEIIYKFAGFLSEISGMDKFTFQPGGGAQAIYTNACIIRAYHAARGESQRDEIITTLFSHPADAATPATAGFKVITLMPDENGYPDLEALKAAVSKRTAGMMITNPEDTGIYNPRVREYVDIVHEAGGLCSYDQANANGILGICRAKEAGFDMCHFNLHKTFSSPHGCSGPGCGAVGVRDYLEKFLPVPVVEFDGEKYHIVYERPFSIGKVRSFLGNIPVVLRAYAWVMSLGPDGIRDVAEVSVINNNYLAKKLSQVSGIGMSYPKAKCRLDQIRYSWEQLRRETGVGTEDVRRRVVDFGVQSYFESHHPWVVPEPFTPEPTETYSKDDIDEYAEILRYISQEAYVSPDTVKNAPHKSTITRIDERILNDPKKWAMTWRAYLNKRHSWDSQGQ
ncbi:MAG TPA: aminomethyl-transferring glycine dehydrogenase subunit GcvPB [Clostridia bacterium]|nr:aminomethyl-transferring glycine dehydrogenase subunit GcvPB [Clostridia bacterium]